MTMKRSLLLLCVLLPIQSCASTAVQGGGAEEPDRANVQPEQAVTSAQPDAAEESAVSVRIPELVRIEALIDAGDVDAARTSLSDWAARDLANVLTQLDDERGIEVALEVDVIAGGLAIGDVQLVAREHVHAARERLLPVDHPDLLTAKQNLASTRFERGDIEGALALDEYVHAASERLLPAEHRDLLQAKLNLAVTREAFGDLEGAHALLEHVHAAWQRLLPADSAELLAANGNLAATRRMLGDLEGALALQEQVHSARERLLPADHRDLLAAKGNLALTRKELGDVAGARVLEEYVHSSRERLLPADHPDLLRAKQNLAVTRHALGDLSGAHVLFEHVHSAWERLLPADNPSLLLAKLNVAMTRRELGDPDGALALLEHVHSAFVRLLPADHPYLLAAKGNLALTREELGDVAGAYVLQEQVHAARERLLPADHPDLLATKGNLAMTRRALGDIAGAHALFEHVHSAWERLLPADHLKLLVAKQNLAVMRHALGDFEGAFALNEHVHSARERLLSADHPELLTAKQNLAVTCIALGDYEGAHALFEHVHSVRERLLPADHPDVLRAQVNLAVSRHLSGDHEGALALREHVHAALERLLPEDHPELLSAKLNLAVTHMALGNLTRALALEEHVHGARQRLLPADHPDLLATKQDLALTLRALRDIERLHVTVRSLLEGLMALAGTVATHAPRLARSAALREFDRLALCASWSRSMEPTPGMTLDVELLEALESLRLVSTSSNEVARAAADAPELQATLREIARVRRKLAEASFSAPDEVDALEAWRSELRALAEQRDVLERTARIALEARGLDFALPSVASIAQGLAENAAYVGFWRQTSHVETSPGSRRYRATDSLLAFVLTPDQTVRRIELGRVATVDAAVERWRNAIGATINARSPSVGGRAAAPDEIARSGAELRALVLDPVLAAVPNASELRCVLDDVLFLVPLDALPLEGGVVGDRYTLRVGSTVRQVFPQGARETGAPSLLVLGGVDYSGAGHEPEAAFIAIATPPLDRSGSGVLGASFDSLPGATLESELVAARFSESFALQPTVIRGAAATKAALVEHVENARYLHVATHGWFALESAAMSMLDSVGESANDDLRLSVERAQDTIVGFLPETLCGLALAGANHGPEGILTAEELATLDLSNCELAVLSACETNVGIRRAGQGIQSLQTALHAAGARTAVTSLWKVDDAATRRLFELFYTKLWREKLGPADALWQAKMALRTEGHPTRDWAGWVLTGDPD